MPSPGGLCQASVSQGRALGVGHSALALGTRHAALGTRHSALGTGRWALGAGTWRPVSHWRYDVPVPFSSIVGHSHVVALLRAAASAGRVPQSLLLAGPEGVGKRTLALAIAQAVNCPRRRDGDACGTCATCQRIVRGQHSDVTLVGLDDEASIKVEKVRARILHVVGYRPFEAERRVYIVDPADDMVEQAQDALLKTLEEPPPSAILILVSAYADTLLPTVQSRCRRLRLGPLPESDVARVLAERCGMDPARTRVLAAASGGSVSRALAMADDQGQLAEDRQAAFELIAAAGGRLASPAGRLKAAAAFVQHPQKRRAREAVGTRLAVLSSYLRDLGLVAAGAAGSMVNADLERELRGLAPAFPLERLSTAFAAVARAQRDLEHAASPKIVADWVALGL